jgi:hypothetical protein
VIKGDGLTRGIGDETPFGARMLLDLAMEASSRLQPVRSRLNGAQKTTKFLENVGFDKVPPEQKQNLGPID